MNPQIEALMALYGAMEECDASEQAVKKDAFDAAMAQAAKGDPDKARKLKAAIQTRYWARTSVAFRRLGQSQPPLGT